MIGWIRRATSRRICEALPRRGASLDHLVGPLQRRLRHRETERPGGLQIDHKLERCRLLDRQIGWLGSLEDLSGINADLAIGSRAGRSIADQAASGGEFTPLIDRRNVMACCKRHELVTPAAEELIGADEQRAGLQWDEGCKSGVDLAF